MSLRYLPLSSFKQEKNSFVLMKKWWNSKQGSWRMICTRHSSGWLCHVTCRNGNGVREKRSVYIFSPHTLLNLISFNLPLLIRDTATDFQALQLYVTQYDWGFIFTITSTINWQFNPENIACRASSPSLVCPLRIPVLFPQWSYVTDAS